MGTRRGNGDGSIVKRGDSYRGQVLIAGRRHSVTGKTKREAQQKLRELQVNAERGIVPSTDRLTVAQHLERWLTDVVKHSVRPRTHQSYSQLARLYIVPAMGTVKLVQLQPAHLQKLYGDLLTRGLSPSTVQRVHAALHLALSQAMEWGMVPRNVADVAHPPRKKANEIRALTPEEVRHLLTAAKGTRWEALLTTAVATGMRQGELLGLKWGDVDLETGVVRVRRQYGTDKQFSEPKTAKARRSIRLPLSALAVLRQHRTQQNQERLLLGPEYENSDLVFATELGRPRHGNNVWRAFKGLVRKAGLPEIRFHDLRHTSATLMLLQGVHPKVVQERLGHAQISMTLDTYSHVLPALEQDAAEKLDALLA